MSQTEQQFDSLCSFAQKLGGKITIETDGRNMRINFRKDAVIGFTTETTSIDQALTEALRYLRKISKTTK